jgi:hypothetical protein
MGLRLPPALHSQKSTGGWSVRADKPSALRHAVKLRINLIDFVTGRM